MATNFVKKWQTPTLVALAVRNGMGYRYLNVRINSVNDASIWCKNFVNFSEVTPDLTELICGTTRPKTGVFRRIHPDLLD